MNRAFLKKTLGSKEIAESVAQRVQQVVPAYKRFLERQGLKIGEPFECLPQSDKKSYALAYPFEELLAGDSEEIFAIFRSSGSSGNSFYWPQLKSAYRSSPAATRRSFEDAFAIHQKKTLAIVGFNLGGWIGGESTSWTLKNIAVDTSYPFWVFSPGNHPDEIYRNNLSNESIGGSDYLADGSFSERSFSLEGKSVKKISAIGEIKVHSWC